MLVMSHSNSYSGPTIISDNAQNTPTILRATANSALGTGSISLAAMGNLSLAQLQVAGNSTLPNNTVLFWGKRANINTPQVDSLSGNNELSGVFVVGVGGSNYMIQSDAGTLTLSGAAAPAEPGSGSNIATAGWVW